MDLFVNVTPVKAGTAEPVGEVERILCPADVEPDTLLSYLKEIFGEPIDVAWTYTERHPRLELGWIFPATAHTGSVISPDLAVELLVVPFTHQADGSVIPFFELQADARQDFENLAQRNHFSETSVFHAPHREYRADTNAMNEGTSPAQSDKVDPATDKEPSESGGAS